MTEPSKAVFLSYASQDAEAARRICDALRAGGIEVWFDQSELRGGDVWDRQIRKQIHDCALFIPIISANTQERPEGYFRLEWKLAVERTRLMSDRVPFLVPVVIDDTRDAEADVPDKFREVQWTRLPGGLTPPSFCQRVTALPADNDRPTPTPVSLRSASPVAQPPPLGRWLGIGVVVVILVAAVALKPWQLLTPKPQAVPVASPVVGIAATAVPEKSIAVLPFVDMSEKHDQEYFSDGMAEEILNLLVKVPELKVIGRTSSFQFKGRVDDLRKVGMALGAAYVVEGSVRRSGNHIRVTTQLIDTRDGAHRWSEVYDREASDILTVQEEIARSLVRALQVEVQNALPFRSQSSVRNSEAYDLYLRGLHAADQFDQRGFEEADADFRRSLELDPSFLPAAEALAMNLQNLADWGFVDPQTGFERTRAAAEAALKLDPRSPVAHAVLGAVHAKYDWDWPAAAREMSTAVTLAPHDPAVLKLAAMERLAVGQWSEAVHLLDTASTADPLNPDIHHVTGWVYVRLRRFADAESVYRRALEITPTYGWGHYFLGIALLMNGETDAALAEMEKEGVAVVRIAGLAAAYQALRRTKDSDAALARLEAEYAGNFAFEIAETYANRGQKDQAFKWLDRAYAQKDGALWYIKGDPLLKNLEGDRRYKAFLRKMMMPE